MNVRAEALLIVALVGCQPNEMPDLLAGTSGGADPLLAPEGSLLRDPFQPLPQRLSRTGLYLALPDRTIVPDAAIEYAPLYPLWSNGSDKTRFLVLPEGTTIDNAVTPWGFPEGTLLWKTFAYDEQAVETRLLRRARGGEWEYAVYRWREDGTDATLLDIELPVPVEVSIGTHTIPARLDCRSCHESAPSVVLGLDALQLAPSLPALADAGVFAAPIPTTPPAIEHPDDTTRRVLGWLHGDCVHCHNGLDGPSSSFDLRADVALQNLVGVESESSGSAGGIRVVPGDPEASLMFLAIAGQGEDVKAMPPVGVDVRDAAAIDLVRAWIEGLP